ncbi:MAG: N-acetylmuramoyl-L-alanine amidase [Marivirga sp.]|jgi:N-acetylmuramoyl-L-alanine amidase
MLFFACESPQKQESTSGMVTKSKHIANVENDTLDFAVDTFNIITEERLRLTKEYAWDNYGLTAAVMDSVQMIVIHYTAIPTLEKTLAYFEPAILEAGRKKNYRKSKLNVGVHYVIDQEGRVVNLMPDSIMGRHLIGFNYRSIGIENVGRDSTELTDEQVESNVKLIYFLSQRHSSIKYLIGHSEYSDKTLAHYKTIIAKDPNYQPYAKYDPGSDFMSAIREGILNEYKLTFQQ